MIDVGDDREIADFLAGFLGHRRASRGADTKKPEAFASGPDGCTITRAP
jgi:hypothetical protein